MAAAGIAKRMVTATPFVLAVALRAQRNGLIALSRKSVEETVLLVAGDAFMFGRRFRPRRKRCRTDLRCSVTRRLGLRNRHTLRCHGGRRLICESSYRIVILGL